MASFEPIPESGGDAAWREFWDAQLASHLAALFGSADPTALAELQADAEWVSLRGGEVLFRRGEPGNAAYTVLCGRVRVVDDSAGELALNEIGAGDLVICLLSGGGSALLVSPAPGITLIAGVTLTTP